MPSDECAQSVNFEKIWDDQAHFPKKLGHGGGIPEVVIEQVVGIAKQFSKEGTQKVENHD